MLQEGAAAMLFHHTSPAIVLEHACRGPIAHSISTPRIGEQDSLRDIQRRNDPDFGEAFPPGRPPRRCPRRGQAHRISGAPQMRRNRWTRTAARARAALAPLSQRARQLNRLRNNYAARAR